MINLNTLAKDIAVQEGGKKEISIAQIKEVLKITLDILASQKPSEVLKVLESR